MLSKLRHIVFLVLSLLAVSQNLCAKYVVQKDKTTGQTTVTKVEGGGLGATGNTSTPQADQQQINILFKELLASFTQDINDHLGEKPPPGKGPSLGDLFEYSAKPDCLPDDPKALRKIRAYSNQLQAYTQRLARFTENVLRSEEHRTYLTALVKRTLSDYNKKKNYKETLTPEDYEKVRAILCDYLVQKGLANWFENWEECTLSLHAPSSSQAFVDGRKELPVKQLSECYYGTLFELTTGERLWRSTDDLSNTVYYYYHADARQWIDYILPDPKCTSCDIEWLVKQVQTSALRYATPIEDIVIVLEGKDLEGAESSRVWAAAFLLVDVIPGGKVFKPVKGVTKATLRGTRKLVITLGKTGKAYIGEVVDGVYKPFKWIKKTDKVDEVIQTTDEVTYLAENGTQQVGKLEVVRSGRVYGVRAIAKGADEILYGKNFASKVASSNTLTAAEKSIAQEAHEILNSTEFKKIVNAHSTKTPVQVEINGRTISYDDAPFSGMTWFEKNGFNIGREAFKSNEELVKTVLHETHRLRTSTLRGTGSAAEVSKETKAAFDFAEKSFTLFE